jgi:hypothetical protein
MLETDQLYERAYRVMRRGATARSPYMFTWLHPSPELVLEQPSHRRTPQRFSNNS